MSEPQTPSDTAPNSDPKPRPNHEFYILGLRRMTGAQRLQQAFELGVLTRRLFEAGLRKRHPDASEEEFRALLRDRLDRCHNRNY